MRLLSTDSLVLHSFDYRETSRIVRLATREAGVISVIARGARRPRSRFGSALDLFTSGVSHLSMHPSRDLHTLAGFDATRTRAELAGSMACFHAASALAEICLRFGREDESGRVHDVATEAFDTLGAATGDAVALVALAAAWRMVGDLGFAPALEECASCHAAIAAGADVNFHHRAGGAFCPSCARVAQGGRRLPAEARRTLVAWMGGVGTVPAGQTDAASGGDSHDTAAATVRAHQRLLREFLEEHLGDGRPLRAFVTWEGSRDSAALTERP